MEIKDVEIIYHWMFEGKDSGVYSAVVNGHKTVFVENNGQMGIVTHWVDGNITRCLPRTTDYVYDQIKRMVNGILSKQEKETQK